MRAEKLVVEVRNPHSVLAALDVRPRDVIEVRLYSGGASDAWSDVVEQAKRHGVPVRSNVGRPQEHQKHRRGSGNAPRRTGAAEATIKEKQNVELKELFADAEQRNQGCGIWLALDQIQDPHNVGAIVRAAAFFGIEGIVVTRDRSAPLSAPVYDVASGGMEHVPVSVQLNLSRALGQAKKAGLWILGTSERADTDVANVDRDRPWLLVLGNEEKGLRRLTRDNCDVLCRLTPRGKVPSLNVSVAAGILMATLTDRA